MYYIRGGYSRRFDNFQDAMTYAKRMGIGKRTKAGPGRSHVYNPNKPLWM